MIIDLQTKTSIVTEYGLKLYYKGYISYTAYVKVY